jgi:hypothetical protein
MSTLAWIILAILAVPVGGWLGLLAANLQNDNAEGRR